MNKEIAALQRLLYALDDSSTLFRRLAPKTTSSHLRLVLERAIKVHQWIADELAGRMTAGGGTPRPGGSLLGPLQALRANWLARISPDIELAYVAQAARCEDDVLQCFDEAVAAVPDVRLRDHLQTHLREIERACTQMEYLEPPLPIRAHTEPTPQWIRLTSQQSGPWTTAQVRARVPAWREAPARGADGQRTFTSTTE
jgi:uncharacterized protein (TIGR02284 family)